MFLLLFHSIWLSLWPVLISPSPNTYKLIHFHEWFYCLENYHFCHPFSPFILLDFKEAREEGSILDTTIICPHSFETLIEKGLAGKTVNWTEPPYLADGLASHIVRSHSPGAEFPVGETWVNYTFEDGYNHVTTCNFSITVLEGKCMCDRCVSGTYILFSLLTKSVLRSYCKTTICAKITWVLKVLLICIDYSGIMFIFNLYEKKIKIR